MKKNTTNDKSMRKSIYKFEDKDDYIPDLEDLEDLDDIDDIDDAEDMDEPDDEMDLGSLVNRRLLFGIAAGLLLALIILIIVSAVYMKNMTARREAIQAQLDMSEVDETADNDIPDAADTDLPKPDSQAEDAPPDSDIKTEAEVGALDDEQDPQIFASEGAEVTVAGVSEDEVAEVSMGIDVSKYQGTIDWNKVKDSGVEFAMIRVGYRAKSTGEIFEDPTARYNMQEAQNAGIMIGAYFFSSAVTQEEARAEAAFTKDIIAKYKITYPVAYNCEDFQSSGSRQHGLDSAARSALACAFLDEVAASGYTPMFYASKGELEGSAQWDTETLASKYKIWVAQYPDKPYPDTNASDYSGVHAMWQYTSQGIVAGISRRTDVNLAYFKYTKEADAKDDTPAEIVEANPEVGIIFTEVNETVTAKQETNLRSEPSTINDDTVVFKLVHGDTATRTGIGHNGWSRVIYNGQTLYAVTSYLTTDMADTGQQAPPQGPVYTPVNEQVTAKIEANLRSEPSTENPDTVVGMLHNGESLTRIGIGDNGWSQLDYNGQTVYAVSSYLTVQQ